MASRGEGQGKPGESPLFRKWAWLHSASAQRCVRQAGDTECTFCYCCSVAWSCPTLFSPMNCSAPGFPVPQQLPKSDCSLKHRTLLSSPLSQLRVISALAQLLRSLWGCWQCSSSPPRSIWTPPSPRDTSFSSHTIVSFYTVHQVPSASILGRVAISSSSESHFVRTLCYDPSILGSLNMAWLIVSLTDPSPLPGQGSNPWRSKTSLLFTGKCWMNPSFSILVCTKAGSRAEKTHDKPMELLHGASPSTWWGFKTAQRNIIQYIFLASLLQSV